MNSWVDLILLIISIYMSSTIYMAFDQIMLGTLSVDVGHVGQDLVAHWKTLSSLSCDYA